VAGFLNIVSILGLAALAAACAVTPEPINQPIHTVDESAGYRKFTHERLDQLGDSIVLLAFSGGGTRAASLSYGVMQELRDTRIDRDGQEVRLLDEVDSISGVSGGSFTAAYYGLYREQMFEDFERIFLRQNVQSTLIRKLFSPGYWINSSFSGFDRTEMAIDFYDRTIFRGATFGDLTANGPPYVDINATDLTTGMRFTFSQELFDFICSDLSGLKVARAVTASSAVPVAFPPVVLKNHADQCDLIGTREWAILDRASHEKIGASQAQLVDDLKSLRNAKRRSYIHLVDGGISDNLGLRAMIDRLEGMGDERFESLGNEGIRNVLLILVNAGVERESFIEQSARKPGAATTMSAYIDSQMKRYDQETIARIRENVGEYQQRALSKGLPLQIFFSEVTFDHVQSQEAQSILNNMPTSLELSDREVDQLIAAGRLLLRREPSYQRFLARNQGRLVVSALTDDKLCGLFEVDSCPGGSGR
jgi:NTE family protein